MYSKLQNSNILRKKGFQYKRKRLGMQFITLTKKRQGKSFLVFSSFLALKKLILLRNFK